MLCFSSLSLQWIYELWNTHEMRIILVTWDFVLSGESPALGELGSRPKGRESQTSTERV